MARPKKNNADYFTHDADMRNDPKIRALRKRYSHMGYAVWSFLLEYLTDCDFFRVEWSELNVELLAADFDVAADELREVVDYCIKLGLLTIEEDKFLTCEKLQERMKPLMDKRIRRNEVKANTDSLRNENVEQTEFPEKKPSINEVSDVQNPQSKVKESKVNIILSDNNNSLSPSRARKTRNTSPLKPPETATNFDNAPCGPPSCAAPPDEDEALQPVQHLRDAFCRRGETFVWLIINAMRSTACLTPEEVWKWLDGFTEELLARGEALKSRRDYQSHFVNWLKIQLEKKKNHATHQNSRASVATGDLSANERRYGSTRAAKQSIENRLKRLSDQIETNVPET